MIVSISSDAEADIAEGYWFYERQSPGLGDYFRSCLIADIESLAYYGGIHEMEYGYQRALSKRFPFCIYYSLSSGVLLVVFAKGSSRGGQKQAMQRTRDKLQPCGSPKVASR